jgi:hypothetical protein
VKWGITGWSFRLKGKKFERVEYETQRTWKLQVKLINVYEERIRKIYKLCS